jgi:hypothetical protein
MSWLAPFSRRCGVRLSASAEWTSCWKEARPSLGYDGIRRRVRRVSRLRPGRVRLKPVLGWGRRDHCSCNAGGIGCCRFINNVGRLHPRSVPRAVIDNQHRQHTKDRNSQRDRNRMAQYSPKMIPVPRMISVHRTAYATVALQIKSRLWRRFPVGAAQHERSGGRVEEQNSLRRISKMRLSSGVQHGACRGWSKVFHPLFRTSARADDQRWRPLHSHGVGLPPPPDQVSTDIT